MRQGMRKYTIIMAVVGVCCALGVSGDGTSNASRLVLPRNGFSIVPLDEPVTGIVLMTSLQATDGFAPNVNVIIQAYPGTLDEYLAMSKGEMDSVKLKLITTRRLNANTVTLEYSGQMQSRSLHWYSKAVWKLGTVYLTTATATEAQWTKVSGKLVACVDSFEGQ